MSSRPQPYASSSRLTVDETPLSPRQASQSSATLGRSTTLFNAYNEPYWAKTGKDWGNDGTPHTPCSTELILSWLELPITGLSSMMEKAVVLKLEVPSRFLLG